jgi:uncharacterized phage-associated protein
MKSAPPKNALPAKLQAVLATLCRILGPLTKTKAVKLPYLVDVLAYHVLGRAITEGTHQTWEHGVVTREVYQAMSRRAVGHTFRLRKHHYSESGVLLELADQSTDLDPDEEVVVQDVAERFGRLDAESLGALTKSLNVHLDREVWGKNHLAAVGEDAYLRMSSESQALHRLLPTLDLDDASKRGPSISDPRRYLRQALDGKTA